MRKTRSKSKEAGVSRPPNPLQVLDLEQMPPCTICGRPGITWFPQVGIVICDELDLVPVLAQWSASIRRSTSHQKSPLS